MGRGTPIAASCLGTASRPVSRTRASYSSDPHRRLLVIRRSPQAHARTERRSHQGLRRHPRRGGTSHPSGHAPDRGRRPQPRPCRRGTHAQEAKTDSKRRSPMRSAAVGIHLSPARRWIVPDPVRFTFTYSPDGYADGVLADVERLKEIGLEEIKLKNLWSSSQYKGINTNGAGQRLASDRSAVPHASEPGGQGTHAQGIRTPTSPRTNVTSSNAESLRHSSVG